MSNPDYLADDEEIFQNTGKDKKDKKDESKKLN